MSEEDATLVESWVPDYTKKCEVCGRDHVVTGVNNVEVVYQGEMCGVCTWGDAECIYPENW